MKSIAIVLVAVWLVFLASQAPAQVYGSGSLGVRSYNLRPAVPLKDNLEQVRQLADSSLAVIRTLLYAQGGEAAANAAGRRMWYDRNTLQLTIVDTPANLAAVDQYLSSNAVSAPGQRTRAGSEIFYLKHQNASDMQGLLNRVYEPRVAVAPRSSALADRITKTLRVEGELILRHFRLRLTRVDENSPFDTSDDTVTVAVRTAGSSQDLTIQEYRSAFVEDFEIHVLNASPSVTPGEGSARLEVRYLRR